MVTTGGSANGPRCGFGPRFAMVTNASPGRKNVEKDRDHDDARKYRDKHPDALEEENNFDLTQVCKDECQAIHDCKEPDVVGHSHSKDEENHRDQFYAGVQALEQPFAFGNAVIYRASSKNVKMSEIAFWTKPLFLPMLAVQQAQGAASIFCIHSGIIGFPVRQRPNLSPKNRNLSGRLNTAVVTIIMYSDI